MATITSMFLFGYDEAFTLSEPHMNRINYEDDPVSNNHHCYIVFPRTNNNFPLDSMSINFSDATPVTGRCVTKSLGQKGSITHLLYLLHK